ncbi:MAG TPA: 2-succinyl-5-enolpyruvyl-6-hydroxy-3-cyclohexene-1-carboxylic-acid synthase [Lysinibacillus sp.]|jgi:2-succinyl-5-enolpyruvyl-6-hydroxy-3-cyclohexene-1-carboxylate synthase|uniref:2-succinyl-5-enolpyruvyl-6-hydroxy-3-cyclohexene-1-carboxylate synthase n=1 Tax=Lysinibacillus fusiformis TaxID=28031 RepID=A0A2I0V2A7_9BACI|nr:MULTISPECIES: 2-succinyl-5-enolpyruvyl-6-hydroxy-3-cyclohexene-1-carboxylic-acid synthase [Lysinibacillus]HBT74234.1 2-succinyl-5-enolpyruvyl-6-hydroxy-3-cyclohexene-1-carboxylic-acid synthase [Lysinibacillus sp.]KUF29390.1 2-succinyl-5-enolpyruvyl-6-hydroxy-3-cyclohexene-1-carboxylate synthase [Lysinibacillus sp. F5]PKU52443.1 2-succinyl-5-enolpyruvyl-6-hydroxy-3-cyclohexene-1-carboxylate synthase [Lysinibacillus fusiformis]SCZ02666.1 2-succinyl-5-enolpyruvyl-6-hydroxy-3-cyclohexene-1-carbo
MSERKRLTDYVYKMVASLVQAGVENVVVSPGSRSTPLAYAVASTKEVNMYRQVDERSAAFFALGLAKATAKPVVLLCTSGTAAANYFPAIVEASYARVPLIVLTADRPHELREVGAPQAINQLNLYGSHVKWSVDFPLADGADPTLPLIERHLARAVAIATSAPFGPVHINVPFREPLLIDLQHELPTVTFKHSSMGQLTPTLANQQELSSILQLTKRGFIIIGELALGTDLSIVWEFVRQLKWPVLVESLSNMRASVPEDCLPYIVTTYDAIMKSEDFKALVQPDTVLRIGAQPVSKFIMQFITKSQPNAYVIIDEDPMFRDATGVSTHFIHATIGQWLTQLAINDTALEETYLAKWQNANELASISIEQYSEVEKDEGAIVSRLLKMIPDGSDIFVSSSMPVRDIDTFLLATPKDLRIFANRGTNGIDGVVSTAMGFSQGNKRETYLLIGDLAFLHDVNGLIASRYQKCNLTILVMNNDGGGIFSYLPQSTVEDHYEDLFGTPTALEFRDIAHMYEMDYVRVETISELSEKFSTKQHHPLRLVEIFTDRTENVNAHRALWNRINAELKA